MPRIQFEVNKSFFHQSLLIDMPTPLKINVAKAHLHVRLKQPDFASIARFQISILTLNKHRPNSKALVNLKIISI
jgi:hypothetical protein